MIFIKFPVEEMLTFEFLAEAFTSDLLVCRPHPSSEFNYDAALWITREGQEDICVNMVEKSHFTVKLSNLNKEWEFFIEYPFKLHSLVQGRFYEFFLPKILKSDHFCKIEIYEDEYVCEDCENFSIHDIECIFETYHNDTLKYIVEKYAKKNVSSQIYDEAKRIALDILPEDFAKISEMVEMVTRKIIKLAAEEDSAFFPLELHTATSISFCKGRKANEYYARVNPILFEAKDYFDFDD